MTLSFSIILVTILTCSSSSNNSILNGKHAGYSHLPVYFINTCYTDSHWLSAAATFDLVQPANSGRALREAGNAVYRVSWHSNYAVVTENICCRGNQG